MSKEVGKMVRSRDVVQAEGSARTPVALRAPSVRADGAAAGGGGRPGAGAAVERQPEARRGAAATACRIAGGAVP